MEKIARFFCFHFQKRITAIDSAQQSKKNEIIPKFGGLVHPKKNRSLNLRGTVLRMCVKVFVKIYFALAP